MTTNDPGTNPTPAPQGDQDGLGDAGRRAIAAERARADAAERDARAARAELEQAHGRITEHETANAALTTERDAAAAEAMRFRIALTKGLPEDQASRLTTLAGRLQGADEEALAADADALFALMGPTTAPPAQAGRQTPAPDPSQGSRTPPPESPEAQFAAALGLNP